MVRAAPSSSDVRRRRDVVALDCLVLEEAVGAFALGTTGDDLGHFPGGSLGRSRCERDQSSTTAVVTKLRAPELVGCPVAAADVHANGTAASTPKFLGIRGM